MNTNKEKMRQIQLTLMAAGIQQFIDQLEEIPVSELSNMTAQELRDFIVQSGKNKIKNMNPLSYSLNEEDKV
ncbi:hypothetical protein VPHK389_0009 [Vibrio phage K389]|nr:hypothetical protein SIPHO010v1_p0083 [Vibrio phage 268E42.1]